jgi:hypothetical protein
MPVAIDEVPWPNPAQFVVGLDIGTAHSSVTFSHLQQGSFDIDLVICILR